MLSAVMMLNYIRENHAADRLLMAVLQCVEEGKVTQDLAGTLTTRQFTEALIEKL